MVVILGITDKAGEWTVRNATAAAVAFLLVKNSSAERYIK